MKDFLKIIGITTLLSLVLIYGQSFIPAIRAGGDSVSFHNFYKVRDGLLRYRSVTGENISDLDVEKSVLVSFVEDALISAELSRRGKTAADVEKFVADNVKEENLDKIAAATRSLYGWSVLEFRKFILYPKAREQILLQEFSKENIDPDRWLADGEKNAKVSVYLLRWKWRGGQVAERY